MSADEADGLPPASRRSFAAVERAVERRASSDAAGVTTTVREHVRTALGQDSPDALRGVLRFSDARCEECAHVRFETAVKSIALKRYDMACVAWDDGGRVFFSDSDDPDLGTDGAYPARVLRDLCASMVALQGKLARLTSHEIDGELCEMLGRVL